MTRPARRPAAGGTLHVAALRRQPKQTNTVVTQTTNGFSICTTCEHWVGKLVTSKTTCACCKNGHNV